MKRFLSQTRIPLMRALKHGLGDHYKLHQWIWSVMPYDPDAKRDFLFRSDVVGENLRVLLLSERAPVTGGDVSWETTEVPSSFLGHGAYRFQLRANPTFRSKNQRLPIFREEAKIREWFVRQFAAAGCDVDGLELSAPRPIMIYKHKHDGDHKPQTINVVDATGTLVVRDNRAFRAKFEEGIGRAKGYGFGLLTLQPIHQ